MDFGTTSLLVFAIFLVVKFLDKLFPNLDPRVFLAMLILAGQGVTLVVAHSDWGFKQVVNGISLNVMNGWSLALVGLALTGLAAFGNEVVTKGIANIGQNRN